MITGGPFKARLRATWHMLRRPGHHVDAFYVGDRLAALHCRDCLRPFFGRVVRTEDVIKSWSLHDPNQLRSAIERSDLAATSKDDPS